MKNKTECEGPWAYAVDVVGGGTYDAERKQETQADKGKADLLEWG